jgi:hypothetical protein
MKDKPSIKKIVFNVNGKTLELSTDEAKELKSILSDLFGEKETVYVDRWHHSYPWSYPHWTYTSSCIGQSGTLSGMQNSIDSTGNTLYLNAVTPTS